MLNHIPVFCLSMSSDCNCLYELKGDLSPVMLKEIIFVRVLNCMENDASLTGWQKLFISYKCFQLLVAVAIIATATKSFYCSFWDKRLKMLMLLNFNMLFQLVLTKFFKIKWTVFVFTDSWSRDQVIQTVYYSKIRLHSASPNEVRLFWYF